jgi:foldase protein PrsA
VRRCGSVAAGPALLLAVACLTGCGASTGSVVARVAGAPITTDQLAHRMSVIEVGRRLDSPSRDPRLRRQAVEYLIASRWVIGDAVQRGLAPSEREIHQRLREETTASFAGGESELRAFLKATGQATEDLEYEARVELSKAKLTAMVVRSVPSVGRAQVMRYYRAHEGRYAIPLRREVWMTNTKTAAAAHRLLREVAAGKPFTAISSREVVTLPSGPGESYTRPVVDHAISEAPLDALMGPVKGIVDYYLFEVKRALPATHQPFAEVESSIASQLAEEARNRALAGFIAGWRRRWRARTDCRAGYVVQQCRQYHAHVSAEDPLEFG